MKIESTKILRKLVTEQLSPGYPEMGHEEINLWIIKIPELTTDFFEMMRHTVFGSLPDKLIRRHLNQIRQECTLMLDMLYGYPDCLEKMQQLYLMASTCLIQILEFQRQHYGKYLDANAAMPAILYFPAAQKIEADVKVMVLAMTRYHADKRLQALVVSKMTGLLKNGSGSWHHLHYLGRLHSCIMELCTGCSVNITDPLRGLLLSINFNTSGFIAYCKAGIEEDLAQNYEMDDRYNCLYRYQREFNALLYKDKAVGFEPGRPQVKAVLLQYVNSELSIMNKRHRLVINRNVVAPLELRNRLPVSISVDTLAYLMRLMFMAGVVIGAKNELLIFISRNFRTPGAGEADISLKSIHNKYRQVVNNTAITVRTILLKMLKQLNEEFI